MFIGLTEYNGNKLTVNVSNIALFTKNEWVNKENSNEWCKSSVFINSPILKSAVNVRESYEGLVLLVSGKNTLNE